VSVTIVRTAVSPLVILNLLEALAAGDIVLGRQFVDGALRRLERAKADQDLVLDDEARTPEHPGTAIDLSATA
jgi:hypothetical protein